VLLSGDAVAGGGADLGPSSAREDGLALRVTLGLEEF